MPLERETGERFVEEVTGNAATCLDEFPRVILSPRVAVQRLSDALDNDHSNLSW